MSPPDGSPTLTLNDMQADEDRMRAALGLAPDHALPSRAGEQSHRPGRDAHRENAGRDSEAAANVVAARRAEASDSLRARLAAAETAMKAERADRVAAQQALADAQRLVQQLQTKLAHAEMAAAEALGAEQKARLAAEARLSEIIPATPRPVNDSPAEPKRRGRPPGKRQPAEQPEPEPVQWWLPSYTVSKSKRARSKS